MGFWDASFARVWQAAGLPFLFIPITTSSYVGLKPEQTNQASALLNVARNLGGTIGISSVQTMLAQREQFHQARLVENLSPLNPLYAQRLQASQQALGQTLGAPGAQQASLSQLYQTVTRQAAMQSYVDVFWALMWFVFAVVACVRVGGV